MHMIRKRIFCTYCKNDCVNKYDPNGNSAIVVGAIGSGILSLTSTVNWPGVFQTLGNIFQQGSMAFLGALNIQSSSRLRLHEASDIMALSQ